MTRIAAQYIMQAELLAASGGSLILVWDADFAACSGKVCIPHITLANCRRQ